MGYTELECYEIALKLRKQLGLTPLKRMTARRVITKVHLHFESDAVNLARMYPCTFAVEPYGQTTRIHLRSAICQIASSTTSSTTS
jgi:hypothetical protein